MNVSAGAQTVRIMIVDDHPIVRQGLRQLIEDRPAYEICAEADSMTEAIQHYRATRADLVVTDLTLKDGSGIELIKELKAVNPSVRILVASMHDESLFAERALRAGAMGYVNKETAVDTLVAAIDQVIHGRIYLSERMTERMLCRTIGNADGLRTSPIDALSDRELETFELIGQGLTTQQIAAKLHLSPKTVETYRGNIKAKLNLKNGTELARQAVQWVLENG